MIGIKEWLSLVNSLTGHRLRLEFLRAQFWDRFFLVNINDLPESLTTNAKLLEDDTSFFSVVHDSPASSASLSDDLLKIY